VKNERLPWKWLKTIKRRKRSARQMNWDERISRQRIFKKWLSNRKRNSVSANKLWLNEGRGSRRLWTEWLMLWLIKIKNFRGDKNASTSSSVLSRTRRLGKTKLTKRLASAKSMKRLETFSTLRSMLSEQLRKLKRRLIYRTWSAGLFRLTSKTLSVS